MMHKLTAEEEVLFPTTSENLSPLAPGLPESLELTHSAREPRFADPRQRPEDPSLRPEDVRSRPSLFRRALHLLGLDRAIGFTLLARGWSSVAGLVILRLIAKYLSPDEQGYYYTFGSLVALQIVFELGFSSVILQLASHEAALLTISGEGSVRGDDIAHRRLASVLQRSVRWYSIASLLMAVTVVPTGMYFFRAHHTSQHPVAWLGPWYAVVFAAIFTFQIDPVFSFLEGCGFVPQVARVRFWQAFTGSLLAGSALLLHHGLFAPSLLIAGQALAGSAWLFTKRKLLLELFRHHAGSHSITWAEVWPFQWRIAISWLSGYFISQLFNPILFVYWGAAAAGQMGMSLTLVNAVNSVALSWVYTKAAPFGQMIARKEFDQLDRVFFRSVLQACILAALASAILWGGDVYLYTHHSPFARRLLSPLPFGVLLTTPAIAQVVNSQALYLRAHKHEKFLLNSILGALFIALSTYFLGRHYAALGMIYGYLAVSLIVGLGLGTYTFRKYRNLWHKPL